jgi:radical SAM protein with 4Fe4S-binding SPASM domain
MMLLNNGQKKQLLGSPLSAVEKAVLDGLDAGCKRLVFYLEADDFLAAGFKHLAKGLQDIQAKYGSRAVLHFQNLPFCLLNRPQELSSFPCQAGFVKLPACAGCRWINECAGLWSAVTESATNCPDVRAVPDKPREVMIEVEPLCNLQCDFCFNDYSFAKSGRGAHRLSTKKVLAIIEALAGAGIDKVRLTGGEPLLNSDVWLMAEAAKTAGLEVKLNTNGFLISKDNVGRIAELFDNVLVSMQAENGQVDNSRQLEAFDLLKEAGLKMLRVGSVANRQLIGELNEIDASLRKHGVDKWEIYRPVGRLGSGFASVDLSRLVDKLLLARQSRRLAYDDLKIINPLPFCAYDPFKVSAVCVGAHTSDGYERMAVDPRGFAKPTYYIDVDLGEPEDVVGCWNHPFMKKMRAGEFLPNKCRSCDFRLVCRGGCRFSAHLSQGDYAADDPMSSWGSRPI